MPRKYRHIALYANDIKELKKKGLTHREIGNKLGLTKKEVQVCIRTPT